MGAMKNLYLESIELSEVGLEYRWSVGGKDGRANNE